MLRGVLLSESRNVGRPGRAGEGAPRKRKRRLPQVCGRQRPSLTKTAPEFPEVAAAIVHFRDDRVPERRTLVPRPRHPHQIPERKVVAAQMINRADQAKAPVAVSQLASVPLPAAIEELLQTNQVRISAADQMPPLYNCGTAN
jgi:hypothetical protein